MIIQNSLQISTVSAEMSIKLVVFCYFFLKNIFSEHIGHVIKSTSTSIYWCICLSVHLLNYFLLCFLALFYLHWSDLIRFNFISFEQTNYRFYKAIQIYMTEESSIWLVLLMIVHMYRIYLSIRLLKLNEDHLNQIEISRMMEIVMRCCCQHKKKSCVPM